MTLERMQQLADNAIAEQVELGNTCYGIEEISCVYAGTVGEDGQIMQDGILRRRAQVAFKWASNAFSDGTAVVTCRCDHALERGVPVPPELHGDFLLKNLKLIAKEITQRQKTPCEYLGLLLKRGGYEPHPSKWLRNNLRPTRQTVHFKWVSMQKFSMFFKFI